MRVDRRRVLETLASTPRSIPPTVSIRILFGGFAAFAWLWFGIGTAVGTLLLQNADLTSWFVLRDAVQTQGTVDHCQRTSFSQGGGKHTRGTPVYANTYRYQVEREFTGVSYLAGHCLTPGTPVSVEYVPGEPSISRIVGMRRKALGPEVVFVALFPLVGVPLVLSSVFSGRRTLRLLRCGALGWGQLLDETPTAAVINGRRVKKLRFRMQGEGGWEREVTVKTAWPDSLEDDAREPLLYLPESPDTVVAFDMLRTDLRPESTFRAMLYLLVPLLALGSIVYALSTGL
jgi:hypothetical protein